MVYHKCMVRAYFCGVHGARYDLRQDAEKLFEDSNMRSFCLLV